MGARRSEIGARHMLRARMSAAERRAQLLDTTKQIVGERGFHAVSIEAVARRAGITRPVVYGHFEDLERLLEAMIERESERALKQLADVVPRALGGDPREALLAALRGYLEAVHADPVTWRLVLMPPEGAPEVLRAQIADGRDAVIAVLAQAVQPAGPAPGVPSPDPELTARLLSAAADEAARLLLTDSRRYPIERLVGHADWILEQLGRAQTN